MCLIAINCSKNRFKILLLFMGIVKLFLNIFTFGFLIEKEENLIVKIVDLEKFIIDLNFVKRGICL